jgi:glycosyltransferase involved in cell wall biosynthesis
MDKINLYTLCWNEIDILPFCVDYWKRFASHVYVYDNGSTDGSVEFLNKFPDFITLRSFESDGLNDIIQRTIKNNCWKESRGSVDWVVVCDCDELIYSNHLFEELDYMKKNGYTAMGNVWYSFFGDSKPDYQDGKLLHELVIYGALNSQNYTDKSIGKIMLFNPNEIDDMRFDVGCHTCSPIGNYRLYKSDKVYTLHIDKGFGINYKLKRFRLMNNRLSATNKRYGLGIHYSFSDDALINAYNNGRKNSIDLRTLQ